jgi:hypothetical protein
VVLRALELVVVGTSVRRGVERAEGLGHEGVDEPVVAHISGNHDLLFTGSVGDRAGTRVVLARPGVGVALRMSALISEPPSVPEHTCRS